MYNLLNGFLMCSSMCKMHFTQELPVRHNSCYVFIEMAVIILNKCLANLLDLYFYYRYYYLLQFVKGKKRKKKKESQERVSSDERNL